MRFTLEMFFDCSKIQILFAQCAIPLRHLRSIAAAKPDKLGPAHEMTLFLMSMHELTDEFAVRFAEQMVLHGLVAAVCLVLHLEIVADGAENPGTLIRQTPDRKVEFQNVIPEHLHLLPVVLRRDWLCLGSVLLRKHTDQLVVSGLQHFFFLDITVREMVDLGWGEFRSFVVSHFCFIDSRKTKTLINHV
jgi:hypothetical protein